MCDPVAVAVPISVAIAVAVPMAPPVSMAFGSRWAKFLEFSSPGRRGNRQPRQAQPYFSGRTGLPRVASAEIVLHAVPAQTLRALLSHDPGDGVGHVALAAPVWTDDRGDTVVEGKLRAIGERLKPVNLKVF